MRKKLLSIYNKAIATMLCGLLLLPATYAVASPNRCPQFPDSNFGVLKDSRNTYMCNSSNMCGCKWSKVNTVCTYIWGGSPISCADFLSHGERPSRGSVSAELNTTELNGLVDRVCNGRSSIIPSPANTVFSGKYRMERQGNNLVMQCLHYYPPFYSESS